MRWLASDLRIALRVLAKAPAYTAVAAITIGLAIAANTVMFSVVSGVLIKPLPYRDPDRLVTLAMRTPAVPETSISALDLVDWRKQQKSFEDIAGFRRDVFSLTGVDQPEQLYGYMVTASLLPMLGVEPQLGRHFLPEEDRVGVPRVAMISHGLWQQRFGGDRHVIGRTLTLDDTRHTIVGVLPPSFSQFDPDTQIVVPLDVYLERWWHREIRPGLFALARLKPGVTLEQARADMEAIGNTLREQHHPVSQLMPLLSLTKERVVRDVRAMLLGLMGAVGFVLLIAVANVANLMLARGATRRKEMAIRAALGAGRGRLVRLLLIESAILSLIGGGLGLLLALWGVDLVAAARPRSLPTEASIDIDVRVFAFSLLAALLAGFLAGLVPALTASRTDLARSLKQGDARTTSGDGSERLRAALVVAEVALSLVLLVGAGAAIQSLVRQLRADHGYTSDQLLTMVITPPKPRYADNDKLRALYDQLESRVATLPGVVSASLSGGLPLAGAMEMTYRVEGRPAPPAGHFPLALAYPVSPSYHATLQTPIIKGRAFDARDTKGAPEVVIIDEHLAAQLFPNEDPLGKRLTNSDGKNVYGVIVGVARHATNHFPGQYPRPTVQLYVPFRQSPETLFAAWNGTMVIAVRTAAPPAAMSSAVTAVVRSLDSDLTVFNVKTMEQRVTESFTNLRFVVTLLALFAALALVLAVVGLYAVMSYLVTQRTHEIGIRMALGAQAGDVQLLVLKQSLKLTGLGLAIGLLASLALGRVMASLLYGVSSAGPATYAAVASGLAAVALLASYLPARRATRVDPLIALRYD